MIEVIAWVGSVLLATSSVPQAWACWKRGNADGLSPYMLWMWGIGMSGMLIYALDSALWPLVFNYAFNLLVWGVITRYWHFPRRASS